MLRHLLQLRHDINVLMDIIAISHSISLLSGKHTVIINNSIRIHYLAITSRTLYNSVLDRIFNYIASHMWQHHNQQIWKNAHINQKLYTCTYVYYDATPYIYTCTYVYYDATPYIYTCTYVYYDATPYIYIHVHMFIMMPHHIYIHVHMFIMMPHHIYIHVHMFIMMPHHIYIYMYICLLWCHTILWNTCIFTFIICGKWILVVVRGGGGVFTIDKNIWSKCEHIFLLILSTPI